MTIYDDALACHKTVLCICQVCVTGLPNYQEHESAFVKACKELRHKLTYATGESVPQKAMHLPTDHLVLVYVLQHLAHSRLCRPMLCNPYLAM